MGEPARPENSRSWTQSDSTWVEIGLFDLSVSPLTATEVADLATRTPGKRLLLNHNLHSAYLHEVDGDFRRLYERADWVVVDGAPILWLASYYSGHRFSCAYRISSTDWVDALSFLAGPHRLFIFGATAESNREAVKRLRERLTDWAVDGVDGYVSDELAIRQLNDFNADLVLIGLGMPRQEYFLLRHYAELPDATYATVGGAIDYIAGATKLAPRWLGRFGIEWLWRLLNEPRRLAYRYLIEPLLLLIRLIARRRFGAIRARSGEGNAKTGRRHRDHM
ncbi:WecB/TagA/CpsF family glycosyltransferase [Mycobacterium sp. ZZG]